jgi:hypothetical protein
LHYDLVVAKHPQALLFCDRKYVGAVPGNGLVAAEVCVAGIAVAAGIVAGEVVAAEVCVAGIVAGEVVAAEVCVAAEVVAAEVAVAEVDVAEVDVELAVAAAVVVEVVVEVVVGWQQSAPSFCSPDNSPVYQEYLPVTEQSVNNEDR